MREENDNDNDYDKIYISISMKNIDSFITQNEYRKAFGLLILVLERLDENQKNRLIEYYSTNMARMGIFGNVGQRL